MSKVCWTNAVSMSATKPFGIGVIALPRCLHSRLRNAAFGTQNNDLTAGNEGENLIEGVLGNDRLTGRGGSDTFLFTSADGADVITDFESGIDLVQIKGAAQTFDELQITAASDGLKVDCGNGFVVLENLTSILENDFTFLLA